MKKADRVAEKKAKAFEIDRSVPAIKRLSTLSHTELVNENIAARIPLKDPKKPRKKIVDAGEIPKEVLVENLAQVVKTGMKDRF